MRGLLLIAVAAAVFAGCGGSTTPDCNYTLSITSQSIASGGGPGNLTLTKTAGSCGWTASSDVS